MKTIEDYSIPCTPEQTRKVLELGASLMEDRREWFNTANHICVGNIWYCSPTAEQIRGWLEEQKSITIEVSRQYGINKYCYYIFDDYGNDIENIESKIRFSSRKEATLAAIDAALEYLSNNKVK